MCRFLIYWRDNCLAQTLSWKEVPKTQYSSPYSKIWQVPPAASLQGHRNGLTGGSEGIRKRNIDIQRHIRVRPFPTPYPATGSGGLGSLMSPTDVLHCSNRRSQWKYCTKLNKEVGLLLTDKQKAGFMVYTWIKGAGWPSLVKVLSTGDQSLVYKYLRAKKLWWTFSAHTVFVVLWASLPG